MTEHTTNFPFKPLLLLGAAINHCMCSSAGRVLNICMRRL